jgi:hypothetical protein
VAVALALALASYALYRLTCQARQYGDGPLLVSVFSSQPEGGAWWSHALYLPLASALWRAGEWTYPADVLRVLSSIPAALAVGLTYGLARGCGAARTAAALGAALLAVSPGFWFFATTIELHALHAACVALCGCAILFAPWRRPLAAALIAAAPLPLIYLSHQSGLLMGPGLVLLVQVARRRRGLAPLPLSILLLAVGPLFLAAALAALPIGAALNGEPMAHLFGVGVDTVRSFDRGFAWRSLWDGWLQPLALVLPLAAAGVVRSRARGWMRIALLGLCLPPLAFFLTWGLPERGGYALGPGPFLAVLAALALPASARPALALGALLIALQSAFAWRELRAWDGPGWDERMRSRAQAVERLMPERGVLVGFDDRLQYVAELLPGVVEHAGYVALSGAVHSDQDPREFAEVVGRGLVRQCELAGRPVVVDLSHRTHAVERDPRARAYLDALEDWLSAHCTVTRQSDPGWELLALEGCR